MKNIVFCICILLNTTLVFSQNTTYKLAENLFYYPENSQKPTDYQRKMAVLDVYYPETEEQVPVIIWFHGGGLTGGDKEIPEALKKQNYVIVGVQYRLAPKVKAEVAVADATAAVAWVFKNIKKYNGDPDKIFVSGHSAGGYLALMTVMDKNRLKEYDIEANQVAGLAPFSGHTITHFTMREERGIPGEQPIVDEWAPLYYVRGDAPPTLLITGDREMEMLGRYEENAYFYRMMKVAGQEDITQFEMQGYGHNMTHPAFPLLLNFVKEKTTKN
ncbi:alpha/beta hydrolase [Flavimarina sp. Hel_I_48]|uniref:alpha/beta hydrolase n=1 Tax=Flavimarina sp. Hel_I_48 TaxID=1392488 RepID=UPI0004DF6D0E|nr:alpha/beta hydrolase [Flavimarina sp. Hel_I_48]